MKIYLKVICLTWWNQGCTICRNASLYVAISMPQLSIFFPSLVSRKYPGRMKKRAKKWKWNFQCMMSSKAHVYYNTICVTKKHNNQEWRIWQNQVSAEMFFSICGYFYNSIEYLFPESWFKEIYRQDKKACNEMEMKLPKYAKVHDVQ